MQIPAPALQGTDPDWESAQSILRMGLELAMARGADEVEASLTMNNGLRVNVRRGEIEAVEHQRTRSLTVHVYCGKRRGTSSSNDFGSGAVAATVETACSLARYTEVDPYAGLADPRYLSSDIPALELDHPWPLDADGAAERARACEAAAFSADPRIANSEGATVASRTGMTAYANSHGFLGHWTGTRHSIGCSVIARAADQMQTGSWYDARRRATDLNAAAAIGARAGRRAAARLGARQPPTATVPVIFEAPVAASLFLHFVHAISGVAQYRRASFLLGALGESIGPEWLVVSEQPHLPYALGSAPFDVDGLPTRARTLVADGRLQCYKLSVYSARRLQLEPTGNAGAVHNLVVMPGKSDLPALIGAVGRGLFVTELLGFGVNVTTGDYSRGAAGFWIENGALQYPVTEFTVAGNLREMFRNLAAIGTDIDTRGTVRTGSVLIDGMTVAGR